MGDRNLIIYDEAGGRSPALGMRTRLYIERSAAGQPALLFTIEQQLRGEPPVQMTIVVDDGNELLRPVLAWLWEGQKREQEAVERAVEIGHELLAIDKVLEEIHAGLSTGPQPGSREFFFTPLFQLLNERHEKLCSELIALTSS